MVATVKLNKSCHVMSAFDNGFTCFVKVLL
jgi:hypothetical protein